MLVPRGGVAPLLRSAQSRRLGLAVGRLWPSDDDGDVDDADKVISVGEDKEEVEGSNIADTAAVDN